MDTGKKKEILRILFISFLILSITAIAYWQVGGNGFISFDDDKYVTGNRHVTQGLTWEGVSWAFSFSETSYWHPLTWLSHMADCQFFGLNAGLHHLMNLAFHLTNSLLLFFVLRMMTGAVWRSAFAACLFAVHPMNVDSVAWVAERKNLLSTTFWMLIMTAYVLYARNESLWRYLLVLFLFVLGLLAKPMLVTLPFVLLLLDFWPLERIRVVTGERGKNQSGGMIRFQGIGFRRLVLEKFPLLILSLVSVALSSYSIHIGGKTIGTDLIPMGLRIQNAIVSYVVYLGKFILPINLTFFYPYPTAIPFWQVGASTVLLAGITITFFLLVFRAPYLLVGWLWFAGVLVPVSGLMQGGLWPAIAERWAYVPYIGLFIIVAWGGTDLVSSFRWRNVVLACCGVAILATFTVLTWRQVAYWKDDFTLFNHGISISNENYVAHNNLGGLLADKGDFEGAYRHFSESLRVSPQYNNGTPRENIGIMLGKQGKNKEAVEYLRDLLITYPDNTKVLVGLGDNLAALSQFDEAVSNYERALIAAREGRVADIHSRIGNVLIKQGKVEMGVEHLDEALRMAPNDIETRFNLALVYFASGKIGNAAREIEIVLQQNPKHETAHYYHGNILVRQGKLQQAIKEYKAALDINPGLKDAKQNLGVALARDAGLDRAIEKEKKNLSAGRDVWTTYVRLGDLYGAKGEAGLALENYSGAQSLQRDNFIILHKMALIQSSMGDYAGALRSLEGMLRKQPGNAEIYYNIACVYAKLDRRDEAVGWIRKAVDKGFSDLKVIQGDEDLDNIRRSEGYTEVLRRIGGD